MPPPEGWLPFPQEIVKLIGIGAAADPRDRLQPVSRVPRRIFLDESVVARLFHARRDFVDRVVPRNVLPVGAPRPPHLRLEQAPVVHNLLLQRGTLGAKRAAVGRM